MKKKKTISLILAIVLSFAVFIQNIQAIRTVRAAEPDYGYGDFDDDGDGDDGSGGYDEEASRAAAEQASREAAEQASREKAEEASRAAEQASKEAEEAEEARKKQEAMDKIAKENEEAQKQQSQDDAAKAAQELADKKTQEAEKAASGSDNDKNQKVYKINASPASINFGEAPAGGDRPVYTVQVNNVGTEAVDFDFSFGSNTGAFTCTLDGITNGNSYNIAKNGAAIFQVSMKNNLSVGTYTDSLVFRVTTPGAPACSSTVSLKGTVESAQSKIKSVSVSPQNYKLSVGDNYQFTATVKDADGETKGVSQDVSWEVRGARSGATDISSSGVLSIARDESSSSLTVYAFSMDAPSVYGTSNVIPQRSGYNVSVASDPKDGGTVTGGGSVPEGGSVTLTAIPNKNYSFVGWIRDGQKVSTATNYTIDDIYSSIGVTAKFDRKYVTIDLDRNNDDGGKVSGGGKIKYGDSTTITAKANDGYVFTGWKEDGSIISKDASLKLKDCKEDRKIKGMFERTSHTITLYASPAEGGKVSGGGTFSINQGTTVTATPNSGYTFVGWEVNGQIVNRNAKVKIDRLEEDYKCTAIFIKTGITSYEISAGVATTGGSISPSGKRTVAQGQNITYTIVPKAGYAILAVAVDNVQVGPVSSYTFSNVQSNHTIAAAFLLTDAGKAKGASTQSTKVEKKQKTPENTASSNSTVTIDDALSGEGGDDYVEEMHDLDTLPVPTDEELGVTEEDSFYSDVAGMLGVSQEEAREMAMSGDRSQIARAAFYAGALDASAENELEPKNMNGVDYSSMTSEELMQLPEEEIYPSYTNLDVVVENLLTTDDMVALVDGGTESVAISLTKLGKYDVPPSDEQVIKKNAVGQKPLQYFDLSMLKTVNGYTDNVHEIGDTLEIVIEIPDEIYKAGKTYSVLRVHEGELKVLPDLDDNPKTITFRTDRFSSYAIAQEVASSKQMVIWFSLGALIALLIGLTCFLILIMHQAKMRKERRRIRAEQRRRQERF